MARKRSINLAQQEIAAAFADAAVREQFPPVLDPAQVARMLGVSVKTVYLWKARGIFDNCCRKHGKHLFFWRDRVVARIFNGS